MEKESENSKRYDPQEWARIYNLRVLHRWELFTGLIACGKFASAADIAEAVPESMMSEFREYVMEMKGVKDDTDIVNSRGDAPSFGVAEVQKLVKWFEGSELNR